MAGGADFDRGAGGKVGREICDFVAEYPGMAVADPPLPAGTEEQLVQGQLPGSKRAFMTWRACSEVTW